MLKSQRGQALILVLILLGLAGLIIGPGLSLINTSLKSRGVFAKDIRNDYAADSCIEYGMWRLKWEPGFASSLPIGVESEPFEVTLNGVTCSTTIVAQAPSGQLSGQPLAGPAQDIKFKLAKQVLPSTAQPGVLTEFTYYVSIQCMDPNGCVDVAPDYDRALERIEDCLPQGLTYVAGSVGVYPTMFTDDFNRSDGNTLGNGWSESETVPSDARINNDYVRMRLGASITQAAISTASYTDIFITYLWRGDNDAEIDDTLVVEWKRSDSATWATLATHDLSTSTGQWTSATYFLPASANDTTIDIRFTANTNQSDEEARLDDIWVRSNVPEQQGLWDPVEWGVVPFEPSESYDAGNCNNSWRLRWDFNPDVDFIYGQTRNMAFKAEGTLAEGVSCNRISVLPDNNDMRPGGTAKITVGDPAETRCSGGLMEVDKTTDTSVIYPNEPTTITYTITIKNVDTIPIEIRWVRDYLPTTGVAAPTFEYVPNSAHAFIDRWLYTLLFQDTFNRPNSDTVLYWTDGDGGGNGCRINTNRAEMQASCAITKSGISTVGHTNITLTYDWDRSNTESSDLLRVEWKRSDSGTWSLLVNHPLNNSGQASWVLPASANNTSIDIRFTGITDQSDERARLDNVKVKSEVVSIAFDGFEGGAGGGTGAWNGSWTLSGDTSFDTSGEYQGSYHLRLRGDNDASPGKGHAQRSVNLTGYPLPYLRFWARLDSFESGDTATVKVSTNGTTWDTLRTFINGEADNNYHFYEFNLSSYGSPATFYVAFDANMDSTGDNFYIDNVEFSDMSNAIYTPICMPDQNAGADFFEQFWYGGPAFRWGLEWEFSPDYPDINDSVWNPGGLCGLNGLAGGALRPPAGYEWADYNPLWLQPGETLTIVFQAVVTLTASGSYYNEVFVRLEDDINGTDTVYSFPTGGVTVPQYDIQASTLLSILRANSRLQSDGVWKRSHHWQEHR